MTLTITIDTAQVADWLVKSYKAGSVWGARQLGWALLGAADGDWHWDGDSAERNAGLAVFEGALEWDLGLMAQEMVRARVARRKETGRSVHYRKVVELRRGKLRVVDVVERDA